MSGFGAWKTLSVALVASTAGYTTGLSKAAAETKAFGTEVENTLGKSASKWESFGGLIQKSALFAGAAVAAGLAAAVSAAAGFDQAMRNVYSLGSETTPFATMESQVLSLAKQFPQSAKTVADGLYDIESSGFSGSAALEVLQASLVSASAGMTDTATAARAITGVMNAYGPSVGSAAHVSDVLFQTVNDGVVTFGELAQNIGDFIPMAATLGISLEDVSAAMATITLAGVPAAEAATSLNRVMMSFLKPTSEMSTAMGQLGISLSDLSNPAVGLHGVMERLREAYGDNTVALTEMFGDVRSVRGALALFAQDGETWNRVQGDMANSSGAAKRAFDEQMQGLSMQLDVLKQRAVDWLVVVGTKLIPTVLSAGKAIGSGLGDVLARLQPVWQDLVSAGHSLADVFEQVWHAAEPFVKIIAGLALGAAIGALKGLASILSGLAGFLDHNHALVLALTSAMLSLAAVKGVSALASGFSSLATILDGAVQQVAFFREAVEGVAATRGVSNLTAGVGVLKASLGGVGVATAGAFTVATAAIYGITTALNSSKQAAANYKKNLEDTLPATSFSAIHAGIVKTSDDITALGNSLHTNNGGWDGFTARLTRSAQMLTPMSDTILETSARLDQARKSNEEYQAAQDKTTQVVLAANLAYGLSVDAVDQLAQNLGIDWTKTSAAEAFQKISDSVGKLAQNAGVSTQSMQNLLGAMDPDLAEAFAKAMSDAGDAVQKTYDKFFDVTSSDATSGGGLAAWLKSQIGIASTFTSDISAMIQKGFDPALVSQLIVAGPAQAAPLVHSLATQAGQDIVGIINTYEQQIQSISQDAVWAARIMAAATNAAMNPKEVQNTSNAITAMHLALQGMQSIDIAKKLGMAPDDFNAMVKSFGLAIDQIQTTLQTPQGTLQLGMQIDSGPAWQEVGRFLSSVEGTPTAVALNADPKSLANMRTAVEAWADTTQAKVLLQADPTKYKATLDTIVQVTSNTNADLVVGFDPASVAKSAANIVQYVNHLDPTIPIGADPSAANNIVTLFRAKQENAPIVTQLDSDPSKAYQVGFLWTQWANSQRGQAVLSADPASAYAQYAYFAHVVTGSQVNASVGADTSPATTAIEAWIQRWKQVQVTAVVHSIFGGPPSRWGNVFPMAQGGVSAYAQAGIGSGGPLYKWAEPETGGEAFIPRLGAPARSLDILKIAAGWYGMKVLPAGPRVVPAAGGSTVYVSVAPIVTVDMRGSVNGADEVAAAVVSSVRAEVNRMTPEIQSNLGRLARAHS